MPYRNSTTTPLPKRRFARGALVRYPRAIPLALFALILLITGFSVFTIERGEKQRNQAILSERAIAIASALERLASANSAYLRAGAALFSTRGDLRQEEFNRFVSELRLDSSYRGAEGIGWAPRVLPSERAAWEEQASTDLGRPVTILPQPRPGQEFSTPVMYLQPDTERNRRALGYDMYSDPVRREAMNAAREQARPRASGRVVLQQDGASDAPGFLIYMPVYQGQAGAAELRGFVYSPLNGSDFLESALQSESLGDIAVRVYDEADSGPDLMASAGAEETGRNMVRAEVDIVGRTWILEVSNTVALGFSAMSMVTLLFGILVASLLMIVVRLLTQQAIEDKAALTWFEEQNSIRNSLTRELNHRVKNTLANVLSIVALTRRRASSLDEFAAGLDGRIRALSATHDLLTSSEWGTTPIRAVVDAELAPYARGSDAAVDLEGPDVELAPNDALSLGLALHELATNATKYGALSEPGGTVRVHWRLLSKDLARIEWQERGGPPVAQDRGRGFGTELIQKIVAHELKNPVDLRFEPEGVSCSLTVSVRQPKPFAIRSREAPGDSVGGGAAGEGCSEPRG